MSEIPYTNREINEWRVDVQNKLEAILNQTTSTNGRVRSLEVWRGVMVGGLGVIIALVLPILFMLFSKDV